MVVQLLRYAQAVLYLQYLFAVLRSVLKEVWCNDWGDFDFVVGKIKSCDKTFINMNNYSEANKWAILDELIKLNKK